MELLKITTRRKKSRKVIFCPVERELSCAVVSLCVCWSPTACMRACFCAYIQTCWWRDNRRTHTHTDAHRHTQIHTHRHIDTHTLNDRPIFSRHYPNAAKKDRGGRLSLGLGSWPLGTSGAVTADGSANWLRASNGWAKGAKTRSIINEFLSGNLSLLISRKVGA